MTNTLGRGPESAITSCTAASEERTPWLAHWFLSLTHRFESPSLKTHPIAPTITIAPSTPAIRFGPSRRRNQRIATNAPRPASAMGAALAFMNR